MAKTKLVRLEVSVSDDHIAMLQALRQYNQISKRRELVELIILEAALDVGSLPRPANLTAKQKEGWEWCHKMTIKYVKPFKKLLQKRKLDRDKTRKIKKPKRQRTRRTS